MTEEAETVEKNEDEADDENQPETEEVCDPMTMNCEELGDHIINLIDKRAEYTDAIKKLEGEDGAAWDLIMESCKKTGLDEDSIEEALTSLMDKGFIFEPVLGTIKTT